MVQVLAFDVDARPAQILGEVLQVGDRCRAAGVGPHQVHEFPPERGVLLAVSEAFLQFLNGGGENLRQEGTAVLAVVAFAALGKVENGHRDGASKKWSRYLRDC